MSPETSNPIVRREEPTRTRMPMFRAVSDGLTTPVYVDRGGRKYIPERRLTAGEIWFDPPHKVYIVDTAVHTSAVTLDLPTQEEAFFFAATITVTWQVADALEAVRTGLTNAEDVYLPLLRERMREVSRHYNVENSADAERAINNEFTSCPRSLPQGMVLQYCTVTLALDDAAREHIAERTAAQREQERRDRLHIYTLAEGERALRESEVGYELEKLKAAHRDELARRDEENKLAIEKLRMDFYLDALRGGSMALIALRLGQNPQDVDGVIRLIMQEHKLNFDAAREFLHTAMAGGVVGPKHVAGAVAQAADSLAQMMRHADGKLGMLSDGIASHRAIEDPPTQSSDRDSPLHHRARQAATGAGVAAPASGQEETGDDAPF